MKGHANSSQTQYLFTIHHDSCFGVYSNSTSVQATLIVQVNLVIIINLFNNLMRIRSPLSPLLDPRTKIYKACSETSHRKNRRN